MKAVSLYFLYTFFSLPKQIWPEKPAITTAEGEEFVLLVAFGLNPQRSEELTQRTVRGLQQLALEHMNTHRIVIEVTSIQSLVYAFKEGR
jgi:hypothetical protein